MSRAFDIEDIRDRIKDLRKLADKLYADSEDFPAINRNLKRILASIKMLEINSEELP